MVNPRKISWARIYSASYWFHGALVDYCSCIIDIHYIHVAQKILVSPIRLGGYFFEVLWNQEFVLETVIQLIFLG